VDVQESVPESLPALTKTFEELLLAATIHGQRIVIVIDALDELPDNSFESAPYLRPEPLPEGAYYIVSARPGEYLEVLRRRLFAVPNELYELSPLNILEIGDILRSAKPRATSADIERIAEASQGNPLYVRAVTNQLRTNPSYNLQILPPGIEGFFRDAIDSLIAGNPVLHAVLGLLSVARTPLSVRQLSQIMSIGQRQTVEDGIYPIRQFLLETDGAYTFYHSRFHEFVTHTVLYQDELRSSHHSIADWLQLPENALSEYRFASLAYHLFESGDHNALTRIIDEQFLTEKVRRLGYAALEDLEFWTRILLSKGDPTLVDRCVSLVEVLRQTAGGDILSDASRVIQPCRHGTGSFRAQLIEPTMPTIPGLEVYVGMLPKTEVSADFYEIVPMGTRLAVAIGDVPSVGFKSAFAARFIGNLFHTLATRLTPLSLGELLEQLHSTIRGHQHFERISMLCMGVDPQESIVRLANAGHPYPVHYSSRRRKCDILPLHGGLLDDPFATVGKSERYKEYALSIEAGDILVLVTDGLTEDHIMRGDPFGYRFMSIVESSSEMGARAIGQAILEKWQDHPRDEDAGDDVSVVVISVLQRTPDKAGNSKFREDTAHCSL
jgi:Stage II sporulation protein E (SpoIIE)